MDCDKEQHGDLVCESLTCNFGPSRMFDEVWMARQKCEEPRLVRRGVVSVWEVIRVWSYPMRSVQNHTKQNIHGEEDLL